MPPDGKLDASGSPRTSSLPENSATALPSPVGRQKRVVLLGGDAGQRLEPVRVVRRAVLDRPVLHRRRDRVGHRRVQRLAVRDRPAQRVIHGLRQARLLHRVVEHQAAERLGRARPARLFRFRHRPVANRADRLAEHCRTHAVAPFFSRTVACQTRIISRACRSVHYAQYPCMSHAIMARQICRESAQIPRSCRRILCEICTNLGSRRASATDQPSSARNSASTIAVAPQISSPSR